MPKKFSFIYPITQSLPDSHRREGLHYAHMGDWVVSGIANKKRDLAGQTEPLYEFEIDEIVYEGTEINPIINTGDILENVKAACLNHIQDLTFEDEMNNEIPPEHKIGSILAKVISMPLRRKVNF